MLAILLYAATSLLYAMLAFHFWRTRWRGASAPRLAPLERAAILAPFALHTWLVYGILIDDRPVIAANAVTLLLTFTLVALKIRYR